LEELFGILYRRVNSLSSAPNEFSPEAHTTGCDWVRRASWF